MRYIALLSFGFVVLTIHSQPAIWWASCPVKIGEHVLLSGGGWTKDAVVRIAEYEVKPAAVSETGIIFRWPEELRVDRPRVWVKDAGGESEALILNVPEVAWIRGDDYDASVPGGEIRCFGRCLDRGALTLVAADGRRIPLEVRARDTWNVTARLPRETAAGIYELEVDGVMVAKNWPVRLPSAKYGESVFRLVDFGAVAGDLSCDDAALRAAFAAAEQAGGGIIEFPRGRIDLAFPIRLPKRTLLRGAGRDVSGIYWPDYFNPGMTPLIGGDGEFGLEDLYLTCGNFGVGIKPDLWSHDIELRRLRIRFLTNQYRDSNREDFWRRYNQRGEVLSFYRVDRVTMEEVDLFSDKNDQGNGGNGWLAGPRMNFTGHDHVLRNCSIRGTGYTLISSERALVEGNTFVSTLSVIPGTSRMFFAANRITDRYAGDHEGLTHDLRLNAYGDELVTGHAEGTRLHINLGEKTPFKARVNYRPEECLLSDWEGADLQIVGGRGLGQVRRVVKMLAKDELELDRPFDLAPDATSRFELTPLRRDIHYLGNTIDDAHIAIQLYGGAYNCIIAGNRSVHGGGMRGFGVDGKGGHMTVYDTQYLDNTVVSSLESQSVQGSKEDPVIGCPRTRADAKLYLTRGMVLRGNRIEGGSLALGCPDAIAEGNTVSHSRCGILESAFRESHVIAGNRFEEVAEERAAALSRTLGDSLIELKWKNGSATLEVKGEEPLAVRYWCEDRKATVEFDGGVVRDPEWDWRQRPVYLFRPGTHTLKVTPAEAAAKLRLHRL